MDTFLEKLEHKARHIEATVVEMLKYATICLRQPYSESEYESIVVIGSDWGELRSEGKPLQYEASVEFEKFHQLAQAMLYGAQASITADFDAKSDFVLSIIEQRVQYVDTIAEVTEQLKVSFSGMIGLIRKLPGPDEKRTIIIPDSSALLENPRIESWLFAGHRRLLLMLLPTVLGELDNHKANYRNESLKQRAEQLSRQLNEYRRRGNLTKGIVLCRDRSDIMAIAVEPRRDGMPNWLDFSVLDDRIIASCIEIIRRYKRSAVYLVTRDNNQKIKAEYAGVPLLDVPTSGDQP